jgi:hypothetical protein
MRRKYHAARKITSDPHGRAVKTRVGREIMTRIVGLRRPYAAALPPAAQPQAGVAPAIRRPSACRRLPVGPRNSYPVSFGLPEPNRGPGEHLRPNRAMGTSSTYRSCILATESAKVSEELLQGTRAPPRVGGTDGEGRAEDRRPESARRRVNRPPFWRFAAQRAHNVSSKRGRLRKRLSESGAVWQG